MMGQAPVFCREQVRKTVSAPDYTMSCRATNPTLVIHPVLCADLLTNGQMPVMHFLVAFLPVSFAASSIVLYYGSIAG